MASSHCTGWHHLGARFLRFPWFLHFADCRFFIIYTELILLHMLLMASLRRPPL